MKVYTVTSRYYNYCDTFESLIGIGKDETEALEIAEKFLPNLMDHNHTIDIDEIELGVDGHHRPIITLP